MLTDFTGLEGWGSPRRSCCVTSRAQVCPASPQLATEGLTTMFHATI